MPMAAGELEFIAWVKAQTTPSEDVLVHIGDDAAVVALKDGASVLKVDSVVEGVHFASGTQAEAIGYKAMARPLSDVAAMGCRARFALAAFVLSSATSIKKAKAIYSGMKALADRFGVTIVGGDVTSHDGPLSISVTVVGETSVVEPVRRSGSKAGDAICVTGSLGGSILGKHLEFVPRLETGQRLTRDFKVHAMIDVSDGFVRDLAHLCEAGGVGARLFIDQIPVSDAAREQSARDSRSPLYHALYDGEDYELVFTCEPDEANKIAAQVDEVSVVGEIAEGKGVSMVTSNGKTRKLRIFGWEHRFNSGGA